MCANFEPARRTGATAPDLCHASLSPRTQRTAPSGPGPSLARISEERTVLAVPTKREAHELLLIEEADAWFEYLAATRGQTAVRYKEVEPWAWARLSQRLRASVVSFAQPGRLFEDLGITYIGLVPGHDLRALLTTFQPDEGSAKTFCSRCGANLFGGGWPESEECSVRLPAIDEGLDQRPESHGYVRSVAVWETLPDDGLPRHDPRDA